VGRVSEIPGIDGPAVAAYLARTVGAVPPVVFTPLTVGNSNITVTATDRHSSRWVVRRAPVGRHRATAHDIAREFRIMAAVRGSVPVPPMLALHEDPGLTGGAFTVTGFVDGILLRGRADTEARFPLDRRPAIAASLVDTLVAIHAVDPDAAGLSALRRDEPYVHRQLRRWNSPTPRLRRLHERLSARAPAAGSVPTLVHGDVKLENILLGPDGGVRAIVDWELSTVGDPLSDLATLVMLWPTPGETDAFGDELPSTAPGMPPVQALVDRYAAATGRDLGELPFHVAFVQWRAACVVERVTERLRRAEQPDDAAIARFTGAVAAYADAAERALDT
jgi:aminoglycoside phosphotransferase (APT) family kinase protein